MNLPWYGWLLCGIGVLQIRLVRRAVGSLAKVFLFYRAIAFCVWLLLKILHG
jgi:hypothetical protein